jgi:hypothetical protein
MKPLPLLLLLTTFAGLAASPVAAQNPFALLHTLPAPPTGYVGGAALGSGVAMDGNLAVAGAPLDDAGANDAGVVKVFDAATGALLHVIRNPSPADGEHFGAAVALSGTRLVAGARNDSTGANAAGIAYVFDLAGGTPTVPVAVLNNPSPGALDRFGHAVGISGTRVVVGAPGDGSFADGGAYVFDLAGVTPTVPVAVLTNPAPSGGSGEFGSAVAMAGTRAVVGDPAFASPLPGTGRAYVYDVASATPTVPVHTLPNPTPAGNDGFGLSVAISGSRVVVGEPADDAAGAETGSVHVYDVTTATPTVPVRTLTDATPAAGERFGGAVAISGTRVAVGVPLDAAVFANAGGVRVFDLASASPGMAVLTRFNPTPSAQDSFGIAVAIAGTRLLVGAPGDDGGLLDSGSAYLYQLGDDSPPTPLPALHHNVPNDTFGTAVAMSGTRMAVGIPLADATGGPPEAGEVRIYDTTNTGPPVPAVTLPNPTPATFDQFGAAVAMDGTRVVVGAFRDNFVQGSAYVFDLASGTPAVPVAVLNNPAPLSGDFFGQAVAISGTRVVVGAPGDDAAGSDSGSAYVYNIAGATPTVPVATLTNPGPPENDAFGTAVAIDGLRVAVGAPNDDSSGTDNGSAYVYDLGSATPTMPVRSIAYFSLTGGQASAFGTAVAIAGTRLCVGAPGDDPNANTDAGTVLVYDLTQPLQMPVATLAAASGGSFNGRLGTSVALSGNRLVAGAPQTSGGGSAPGSALLFDLSTPAPPGPTPMAPVATFPNPAPSGITQFGRTVGIASGRVAVGAPQDSAGAFMAGSVYMYQLPAGSPTALTATLSGLSSPAPGDRFGSSVAISGMRAVVGAPYDDSAGSNVGQAYVYNLAGATPGQPALTLHNYFPEENDYYGESVAISGQWVAVVVPGDDAGTVLVYNLNSATPNMPAHALNHPFASERMQSYTHVALDGSRLAVSWPSRSTQVFPPVTYTDVLIYDLAGATPTTQISAKEFRTSGVTFPFIFPPVLTPPVMQVGKIVINDRGLVSVYDVSTPGAFLKVMDLVNPGGFSDDFGWSLGLSGNRIVVGAPANDTGAENAGQVHIYSLASPTPTQPVITLFNPTPAAGERFGEKVAISGSRVVVGTSIDDAGTAGNGASYLFDLDSANPTVPVAILNNPSPAAGDAFSSALAMDGAVVVIGAPFDDTVAPDKGAAWLFASPNADFDADGLFDAWEVSEFAGRLSHGAGEDPDGDGHTNANEFNFLTDPENAGGFFAPGMTRVAPNTVISFPSASGRSYTLQQSPVLPGAPWLAVPGQPVLSGNGSVQSFTVPMTGNRMFFRISAAP